MQMELNKIRRQNFRLFMECRIVKVKTKALRKKNMLQQRV